MFCANAKERRISFSLSPVLLLLGEWLSKLILICKTKGLLCYCFWLMDSFHFSIKNVPLWSLLFQKYSTANFENPYDSQSLFLGLQSSVVWKLTNNKKRHFEILNTLFLPLPIVFGLKFWIYSIWKPIMETIVSSFIVKEINKFKKKKSNQSWNSYIYLETKPLI